MTEIDERFRQMSGVDALATHMRLAPISEVCDAQRAVWIERQRHDRLSLPSGNPVPSAEPEVGESNHHCTGNDQQRLITDA